MEQKALWGKEPIEYISSTRQQLCLNGIWQYKPSAAEGKRVPENGWGFIRVPGAWKNPISWELWEGIIEKGQGKEWEYEDVNEINQAWYQRSMGIPKAWSGRSILLSLRRIFLEGTVYIDGKLCGDIDPYSGTIDLTEYVIPGANCDITIYVAGGYGISGDVFLISRPSGAYINDVFIQTSVREKNIALDIEICGLRQSGVLPIIAKLINGQGVEELRFTENVIIDSSKLQTLSLNWNWDNPTIWDIGKPNMYTLMLEADGLGLEDEYIQDFGFREFWIQGKEFFLNGSKIRLRPVMSGTDNNLELINGAIESYQWAGYNIAELWPREESIEHTELWCEAADRKGFALTAPVGFLWNYMKDWDKEETHLNYEKLVASEVRKVRNHPSVLMWGTNANQFGSSLTMDPRTLGIKKDKWFEVAYWRRRRVPIGEEGLSIIKKHDPTRAVFAHHGGGVGDVYTLNMYLNLIPLQEREEWLTHWVENGELPLMIVEFGTPLHVTFMRGRCDFPEAIYSEPWQTEFCAVYLGRKAYLQETKEYRAAIKEKFLEGQKYSNWHYFDTFDFTPNMQEVQSLFSRNTWRSWRTMGITGGMIPWHNGHGWGTSSVSSGAHSNEKINLGSFVPGRKGTYLPEVRKGDLHKLTPEGNIIYPGGQAIIENNGSTLAWIAGPKEAFTSKEHNYYTGATVKKQIVLINDTRERQVYEYSLRVILDDEMVYSEEQSGLINIAETNFIPLEFELKLKAEAPKKKGIIHLKAVIGDKVHKDSFAFTVFEQPQATRKEIYVFDPIGRTTTHLMNLGYLIREWKGEADAPMVVIGSLVLSKGFTIPSKLEQYIKKGGKVIIYSQDPEWMREQQGLRVAQHVTRRVFKVSVSNNHPVLTGLEDEDLRDWAGEGSLVEAYPEYLPGEAKLGKWWFPYYGYHWGNRGSVTSSAVEKPHFSSWRAILECEFDLAYSPLMELDYGHGKVLLCTLDLEGRERIEPAAALISNQIINYLSQVKGSGKTEKVVLIGSNEDAAFLDELGVVYELRADMDGTADLLIIGADTGLEEAELTQYMRDGGRIYCLPSKRKQHLFGIKLREVQDFNGSLKVPDWAECEGLSPTDLRYRTESKTWIIESGCTIAADGLLGLVQIGKGTALICQLDPESLKADENTYLRFTRWRQLRAIAQLLSNQGAVFTMDSMIFHPKKDNKLSIAGQWKLGMVDPEKENIDEIRTDVSYKSEKDIEKESNKEADIEIDIETIKQACEEISLPFVWKNLDQKYCDLKQDLIFYKTILVPEEWEHCDLILHLGKLDASDKTYFNDNIISYMDQRPHEPHNFPRVYHIPGKIVKKGMNGITVRICNRDRIYDSVGDGGFYGPASEMNIRKQPGDGKEAFYSSDYRWDYVYGDDPYRYFNW